MPNFFQCRHLFTDGHQCGSPALTGELLCYFHHTGHRPAPIRKVDGNIVPTFPAPEDLHAVQRALSEILRLVACDDIEVRKAATLLRGLSTASANLARIDRQQRGRLLQPQLAPSVQPEAGLQLALGDIATDLVVHPTLGTIAPGPEPEPRAEGPFPELVLNQTPAPPREAMYAYDQKIVTDIRERLEYAETKRRVIWRAEVCEEIRASLQKCFDEKFEDRFQARLRAERKAELEAKLKAELETECNAELETRLGAAEAARPVQTSTQQNEEFSGISQIFINPISGHSAGPVCPELTPVSNPNYDLTHSPDADPDADPGTNPDIESAFNPVHCFPHVPTPYEALL